MSLVLILGLLALFFTAAIGVPVAFSIIIGVITYLGFAGQDIAIAGETCLLYTSPSPRDRSLSRMPSSA